MFVISISFFKILKTLHSPAIFWPASGQRQQNSLLLQLVTRLLTEFIKLVASLLQACSNLSTSWEQAVRINVATSLSQQACFKSAAGLICYTSCAFLRVYNSEDIFQSIKAACAMDWTRARRISLPAFSGSKVSKMETQGLTLIRFKQGGTAVDAVEAAVRVMEDDQTFNAGRGSCLNKKGEVECDAMIMDGSTMETG